MVDTNSNADSPKGNGVDKDINGAGLSAVSAALTPASPSPTPPAAAGRPPLPSSRMATSERMLLAERDPAPAAPFDGYGRFTQTATAQPGDAKLEATTRVVNAFVGYLTNACGRAADQMTAADVAALGQLLGTVERLEISPTKRSGH